MHLIAYTRDHVAHDFCLRVENKTELYTSKYTFIAEISKAQLHTADSKSLPRTNTTS